MNLALGYAAGMLVFIIFVVIRQAGGRGGAFAVPFVGVDIFV